MIRDFIKVNNIDLWGVVENGYEFPKILVNVASHAKMKSFWVKKKEKDISLLLKPNKSSQTPLLQMNMKEFQVV